MAMASFTPFFARRLPPLLLPFLLSPRPPAHLYFVFSGGLLQLHRHSSPSSFSRCRKPPQLVPGIDAEEGGVEQQGKKAVSAVARGKPAAAPKAPRPSAPKKPAKPGGPTEGSGGHGGAVHAAPASSSTSSSRGDDKKIE